MKTGVLKTIKTTVLKVGEPTITGRVYTKKVIKKALADPYTKERLLSHTLFGTFGWGALAGEIDPAKIAFVVNKLYWYKNELRAVIDILETPFGDTLHILLKNEEIKFTIYGEGQVNENKEVTDYKLYSILATTKLGV